MSDVLENFQKEHAAAYDQRFEKLSPFKDAMHLSTLLAMRSLPEKANVLVVGAGTGAELLYLASHHPGWTFTAVEPSKDMMDVCRHKVEQAGISDSCIFHRGYAHELPKDSVFHGATSILVSQFLTQPSERQDFFQAIYDRLMPGGCLVSADLADCGDDHETVWQLWLRAIEYVGTTPEQLEGYQKSVSKGVSFFTDAQMKAMLSRVGFSNPVLFFRTILINGWTATR